MADAISIQELIDARTDAKTLEEAVNGDAVTTVLSRLGESYPTLSNALNQIDSKLDSADTQIKQGITDLFQNGGLPATPFATKALMTASALVDGDYAQVTDDSVADDNGLYIKTAGAWVKSAYDPLTHAAADATTKADTAKSEAISTANTYTDGKVIGAVDTLDASALLNRYDLTFAEAAEAVTEASRKRGFKLYYNNEVREYIYPNLTYWDNERFWLRPKVNFEGRNNHFDPSMIYNFNVGNGAAITYGEGRYCVIVPVYAAETATLGVKSYDFAQSTVYPLNLSGVTLAGLTGSTSYTKKVTDTNVAYIAMNIQTAPPALGAKSNLEIVKESMYVTYDGISAGNIFGTGLGDETPQLQFNPYLGGIHKVYTDRGVSYSSRFFKSQTMSGSVIHPEAVFHKLEIQKGQADLYSKTTGNLIRIRIRDVHRSDTKVRMQVSISYTGLDEDFSGTLPDDGVIDEDGFAEIVWRRAVDGLKVRAVVDSKLLPMNIDTYLPDGGEIHPRLIRNAKDIKWVNEGVLLKQYEDVGVAYVSSNMQHEQALPFGAVTKRFTNGTLVYSVQGDASKQHQQTTLLANKSARFNGLSNIQVDAVANYPNNPKVSVLREPSKASYTLGISAGRGTLGQTMPSQWIHPDICYVPEAVGGYKYWMVNSNYPNGNDRQEDADLFVSNNGTDWTRVKSLLEEDDGVGFRLPAAHWGNNYPQGFMAIPNSSNTFEFAFDGAPVTNKITGYLNHDPAISTHNGYVNVYISYNIGVVDTSYPYRFTVCYRTNNGVDWEIVRADGTSFPYNETNAQLIFTKTNGVRNHISFASSAGNEGSFGVSPQIVKVSDTEWYFYAREDRAPASGATLYLARYRGTSPYSFDFANPEGMSTDNDSLPRLWHFGVRYINGLYYCMTHGYLLTSTDGVNFNAKPNQMFWRGMSSDIYKPSFCLGHDDKIKVAYGIQSLFAVPHPFNAAYPSYILDLSRVDIAAKITSTLISEFSSLQDMVNRADNPVADAYVDVVVIVINQASRSTYFRILPCVRSFETLAQSVEVGYDDEVYVVAHMNSRNGGTVTLKGVALNIANAGMQ